MKWHFELDGMQLDIHKWGYFPREGRKVCVAVVPFYMQKAGGLSLRKRLWRTLSLGHEVQNLPLGIHPLLGSLCPLFHPSSLQNSSANLVYFRQLQ